MAIKNTKFNFQIQSNNSVSTLVTITLDGQEIWSGNLAQTRADIGLNASCTDDDRPSSFTPEIALDFPVLLDQRPYTNNYIVTVSVSGGSAVLTGIHQQNNPVYEQQPDPLNPGQQKTVYIGGNPNFNDDWDVVTQPLWDGQPDLGRYVLADNLGITGPGMLWVRDQETCEFTTSLWCYCPVITE